MAFREAFDRLRRNAPTTLKKGTPVTQNNIAREAGYTPSALRKSRFPSLIAEIQRWIAEHGASNVTESPTKKLRNQRQHNRSLRDEIKRVEKERDRALSLLVEADTKILELIKDIEELQSKMPEATVTPLKPRQR
ncbi:hypothetical protein AB4Z34_35850 [Ensifer sp. 2YAB10]|uniref:hypothetical protein n=1 Tax=Ensifer sp. 2YAB10 TaxID=3233021 RepID=UPI003F92EC99